MALVAPCRLIFAPSVLEVEHWELLLSVILWREVYECPVGLAGLLGRVEDLADLAVRNVLHSIEILVVSRNLDAAFPSYRTIIVLCSRIVDHRSVYSHAIVVESFVHRSGSGAGPYAVSVLCQDGASLAAEAEADDNGLSFRGMDSKTSISL